ncbi:MAG: FtsX-like permease family protein [Xanthobacteraceae bacterium]|nr:MAG: FtsX-like permease family protein [Xanthobacteraceae bacterium]
MTPRAGSPPRAPRRRFLMLRYALRDLRGGWRGFYVFIACLALGVMAIAAVGSLAGSLSDGLSREGRTILGGDAAFGLIQREATPTERAFLEARGEVSVAATMRAMARSGDGQLALVEIKAVDARYPLSGHVDIAPGLPLAELFAPRGGVHGAAADAALLARLSLNVGDHVGIGAANFEIRAILNAEPDKLAGGVGFGPRFLISEAALRATNLLQPGSLVRWIYRVRLPDAAATEAATAALADAARAALPDAGWEIRTRGNASPQLERNLNRFTQFLTLVGLAALLVGGVGVANAVKSHLDRRRDVIATFKALGATGGDAFTIYLLQVLMLAAIGAAIGLVIGALVPFAVAWGFGAVLPLPIDPKLQPDQLSLSFAYGVLTALAFGLWPLGRAHDTPVSALFRESVMPEWHWPRRRYVVLMAAVIVLLIAAAIGLAYDRRIAAIFIVVSMAVFALLRLVALALMALARRLPRPRVALLRLALANIHRPGALTPSVVLSLGLGLALLVTVAEIDSNLRRQFMAALPERAPSFYFVDIPAAEAASFDRFVHARVPGGKLERVPMLRGRIVAAHGIDASQLRPKPDVEWVLQSDRGITYTNELPAGSRLVAGTWWGADYDGPPLVSLEQKVADGLGLRLGDTLTVNVLGRAVTATIGNLRAVDWQSLGINFVLVYSPSTFRGAPHTHIATLTESNGTAAGDAAIIKAVADAFPTVTAVRVREALESVGALVTNLVLGIRGASAVTLLAAMLVLGGALAAGHRHRVYDAVILKTLGATRPWLIGAYVVEYLIIGLVTAAFGVIAGSMAAWLVVTRLMSLGFVWQAGGPVAVVLTALVVILAMGLIGTLAALNQKPAPVLRNL